MLKYILRFIWSKILLVLYIPQHLYLNVVPVFPSFIAKVRDFHSYRTIYSECQNDKSAHALTGVKFRKNSRHTYPSHFDSVLLDPSSSQCPEAIGADAKRKPTTLLNWALFLRALSHSHILSYLPKKKREKKPTMKCVKWTERATIALIISFHFFRHFPLDSRLEHAWWLVFPFLHPIFSSFSKTLKK